MQFSMQIGPQRTQLERDIRTVYRDLIGRIRYTYAADDDFLEDTSMQSFAPHLHNNVQLLEVELLPNFSYEVGS
jgi:hypothetical protein